MLRGSTIARGVISCVTDPRRTPCSMSLDAVVTPKVVVSVSGCPLIVASMESDCGCQSAVYVISNLCVIRSNGGAS